MMDKKNAQAWSIDMIIAVVIFVMMIGVLYAVMNRENRVDLIDLQVEANNAAAKLKDPSAGDCNFIINNVINQTKMERCFQKDPNEVRKLLGLDDNFCIFIEDREGRVIYVSGRSGVGDDELIVGATPCGEMLT